MADEKRVSLVVEGKAKGLAELDKSIAQVSQTAEKGAQDQSKSYEDLEKKLEKLTASTQNLKKVLGDTHGVKSLDDVLKIAKTAKGLEQIEKRLKQLAAGMAKTTGNTSQGLAGVAKQANVAAAAVAKLNQQVAAGGHGGGGHGGGGGGGHGGGGHGHGKKHGHQHKHSFLHGFLEGVLPGQLSRIIESDTPKAMMRQAGGIIAGESLKEGVGGLASMPFSGEGGIVRAMESIPGVGGAGAAMTERVLGQAKQAIAFRRQESSLSPFLGGVGVRHGEALNRARERAYEHAGVGDEAAASELAEARKKGEESYIPNKEGRSQRKRDAGVMQEVDIQRRVMELAKAQGVSTDSDARGMMSSRYMANEGAWRDQASKELTGGLTSPADKASGKYLLKADDAARHAKGQSAADAAQVEIDAKRAEARAELREKTLAPIQEAGAELGGLDLGETQQYMARAAQRGGGTARDLQRQGLVGTGIAAQTVYGIGAETTGAFSQAGRVGGVTGGGLGGGRSTQNGSEIMMKAINDGLKQGLEGSELTEYMQQMATSIEGWKTTGMPLALDSIGKIGQSLTSVGGMGGQRAALASQTVAKNLQNLGQEGPQDATQALQMQVIGGYKGGGMADFLKASEKLEAGGGKDVDKNIQEYAKTILKAGKGGQDDEDARAMGTRTLVRGMKGLGINLSGKEGELYQRQLEGRTTKEDEKALKALQPKLRPTTAGQMEEQAKGTIGSVTKEEAEKRNREMESGDQFIKTVQSMDDAMQATTEAFTGIAGAMNGFAEAAASAIKYLASIGREPGKTAHHEQAKHAPAPKT